jgi:hypothetical protein
MSILFEFMRMSLFVTIGCRLKIRSGGFVMLVINHIFVVFACAVICACGVGKSTTTANLVSGQNSSASVQKDEFSGKNRVDVDKECPTIDVAGSNLNFKFSSGCATAVIVRPASLPSSAEANANRPTAPVGSQTPNSSEDDKDHQSTADGMTDDKGQMPPISGLPKQPKVDVSEMQKTSTDPARFPTSTTGGTSASGTSTSTGESPDDKSSKCTMVVNSTNSELPANTMSVCTEVKNPGDENLH